MPGVKGNENFLKPNWTPEEDAKLTELWNAGLPATKIAATLNRTSNSVIGRSHRLPVVRRPNPVHGAKVAAPPRPRRIKPKQPTLRQLFVVEAAEGPVKQSGGIVVRECSWPLGDPKKIGFHFCCKPVAEGRVYCPTHVARAYVAVRRDVAA